jgi:flavorubredoxin
MDDPPVFTSYPSFRDSDVRIEEVQEGVYRISGYYKSINITYNQFLIKDRSSTLIHTGPAWMFSGVEKRLLEVIRPEELEYVVLCHFESDEWGGMKFFSYPNAKLVCSRISSRIGLTGWMDLPKPHIPVWEGDRLSLGEKKLRFIMTPYVHHWDSMMAFEETEKALFPADLFINYVDGTPVTNDPEGVEVMIKRYRETGLFASEKPVRMVLPKLQRLESKMIHPMHGTSLDPSVHQAYFDALRTRSFAYDGQLLNERLYEPVT